jgi:hypothetical protein
METKNLKEINKILENHGKRISALEGRKKYEKQDGSVLWYKPGSTIQKVMLLVSEKFFRNPHDIGEIISELETQDYHFKPSDLTLPLRKIVRKGVLKRTKKRKDGTVSKQWLYVKD